MSDNELRDRIRSIVCRQTGCHVEDAGLTAQAVIDDLGLTVEKSPIVSGAVRVVGRWEQP